PISLADARAPQCIRSPEPAAGRREQGPHWLGAGPAAHGRALAAAAALQLEWRGGGAGGRCAGPGAGGARPGAPRNRRSDRARPAGAHGGVAVQPAAAAAQRFARVVNAIGTVTPRPGRFAELAAPGPTRVARIFVAPGQRVAEGDTLIEFERAPFDAAAQSAATALEAAQRNYARAVRLVQAGILPQKDADQAASELAQAQVAAVTARRAQQLATLRAPLPGLVTRMSAVLGASVDANQPLVQVADPAALDVVFNVSPAEAAEIREGDSVA